MQLGEQREFAGSTPVVASGCLGIALAVVLSACESGGQTALVMPTGLSSDPPISASISDPFASESAPFVGSVCSGRPDVGPMFNIAITASRNVNVHDVTIRMLDGTHLGGPMVTFPEATLMTQFGTTFIAAGSTRTFTFRPQFTCGPGHPRSVGAEIAVIERSGMLHSVTVGRSLP